MIDTHVFRLTMRQLAAGVSVITAGTQSGPHGMTATAVTPLSINPPLLLVCVNRNNDTDRLLAQGGYFGVNMLSEGQAALSDRFATKGAARYRFDDLEFVSGPHGAVFFAGCTAAIEAEICNTHEGGDHTIYIGHILWATSEPARQPLVHHQGTYKAIVPLNMALKQPVPTKVASS